MSAEAYLNGLIERLIRLRDTQRVAFKQAAEICADTIADGGLVHLFGTGHGSIPVLEAFPRTGSFVGWHPVVIEAVGPRLNVGGDASVHQFRFLQNAKGYGHAILESFNFSSTDPFIIYSHSGVNQVIVEVALEVKERGHPLIAVTSLNHSSQVKSRHPSGMRLFEIADVVLDTQAPLGEASVEIQGLNQKVGAVSTSLAVATTNALITETATLLMKKGIRPLVLGHIDLHGQDIPDELRHDYVAAYLQRLWRRKL